MKNLINKSIVAFFIVWLQIFEPIKAKRNSIKPNIFTGVRK